MSSTVLPNIWIRRGSYPAKRSSPGTCRADPRRTVVGPTLRTVSIMPASGTSRGSDRRNRALRRRQTPADVVLGRARAMVTSTRRLSGTWPLARVGLTGLGGIVKPGGTGNPMLTISARFAPLPPRGRFWSLLPSLNWNTYVDNAASLKCFHVSTSIPGGCTRTAWHPPVAPCRQRWEAGALAKTVVGIENARS